MEILLHVGQSKTGTSAIQRFLALNRVALAAQGILYPGVVVNGVAIQLEQHNCVVDALTERYVYPRLTAQQYFSQFFSAARRSGARKMILSAEHFFGGEPRIWDVSSEAEYFELYRTKLARLAPFLADHSVKVLVYLRPQVDWVASAIGQTVKVQGLIGRGQVYQNDAQFFDLCKPVLRYGEILRTWKAVFPDSGISAVPYVRDQLHERSSVVDFCQRTGIDRTGLVTGSAAVDINQSLSVDYLAVKKTLNLTPRGKVEERAIIKCLQKLSRRSNKGSHYELEPEVAEAVAAYCEADNTYINEHFITEPMLLQASVTGRRAPSPLTPQEIAKAQATFDTARRSLGYRLSKLDEATRAFLRERARPFHAILHGIKHALD